MLRHDGMNINTITWAYCLAGPGPDRPMDMINHVGPLPAATIRERLGGPYHVQQLRDGTAIAVLDDQTGHEANHHYQQAVHGPVIVGKVAPTGEFVGVIGTGTGANIP